MKKLLFIACCMLFFANCVPPQKTLYSWGKYPEMSYNVIKNNTDKDVEALLKEYQNLIDNQKAGRKTIPPGICADYGYLLVQQGRMEEGLALMKKEIALYPESAVFLAPIIKKLEEQ